MHVTPQLKVDWLLQKKATKRSIVGVTWFIGWLCKHWYAERVFWHLSHVGERSQSGPTCNKQKKGIIILDCISMQLACRQRRRVFRDDAEKGESSLCSWGWEAEPRLIKITSSGSLTISPHETLMFQDESSLFKRPSEGPRLPGDPRSCSGGTLATLTYWWGCSHKIIKHFSCWAESVSFASFPPHSWCKSPRKELLR